MCAYLCVCMYVQAHYGRHDDASVAIVKDLYKTLDLEKVFHDYEETSYTSLCARIKATPSAARAATFEALLNKIYKRAL